MIIYKVTNLKTNKIYIGKTIKSLKERTIGHYDQALYMNSQTNFHRALRKYNKSDFKWEVLCECISNDELNQKEIFYINEFDTYKTGYNMTEGGDGGATFKKGDRLYHRIKHKLSNWKNGNPGATKEAIAKRVETFKNTKWVSGKNHGNYGKPRIDMLGKVAHNSKPVIIDGIEYVSTGIAAKELGLKDSEIVRVRCHSKKWKNYKYKN